MRKLTADWIFDGKDFYQNQVLVFDKDTFVEMIPFDEVDEYEQYSGILSPGFVNTHCHLELSHLLGKVPTGTGLLPFLKSVVQFRDIDQQEIDDAIENADAYMWEQGIQAVGDISNQSDTIAIKKSSRIIYQTFLEMFDFMQEGMTDQMTTNYKAAYDAFRAENLRVSAVPHAPYTVSPKLYHYINELNQSSSVISIHNQETKHENQYFLDKSGGFSDFFSGFGIQDDAFAPIGQTSIHFALRHMDTACKTLFVHNTQTTAKDIQFANKKMDQVFWATCPNANLYIENALPDYQTFIEEDAQLTIGTDSLSSNWQLSVLEELKTIQKYNSYIPIETLLTWATSNGAEALSLDDSLGSFQKGFTPGLIQLKGGSIESLQEAEVVRLI